MSNPLRKETKLPKVDKPKEPEEDRHSPWEPSRLEELVAGDAVAGNVGHNVGQASKRSKASKYSKSMIEHNDARARSDKKVPNPASAAEAAKGQARVQTEDSFGQQVANKHKKAVQMRRRWVPLICLLCVSGLFAWASIADIEQVTRGHGKVIPTSGVQTVQSLDAGILTSIPVKEGDLVDKGQTVATLNNAIAHANYLESKTRYDLLAVRMSRLEAEANDFAVPVYPAGIDENIVETENKLFSARKNEYQERLHTAKSLLEHAQSELTVLERGQKSMTKLDLIRAQREVSIRRGNLATLTTETKRMSLDTHDKHRAELASLSSEIQRQQEQMNRKILRSPIQGIVNKVHIAGEGQVIGSGEGIMEIVPINDTFLIEANIRPEDIGFIHSDQRATIKFTAYDFAMYGGMDGEVEYIGVDTITNERGETYYPVRIRTESSTMSSKSGKQLEIIPGMQAQVDILAGKKTVLDYLMTPLRRAKERALTEL